MALKKPITWSERQPSLYYFRVQTGIECGIGRHRRGALRCRRGVRWQNDGFDRLHEGFHVGDQLGSGAGFEDRERIVVGPLTLAKGLG